MRRQRQKLLHGERAPQPESEPPHEDPERHYSVAAALAEPLNHFTADEIEARVMAAMNREPGVKNFFTS